VNATLLAAALVIAAIIGAAAVAIYYLWLESQNQSSSYGSGYGYGSGNSYGYNYARYVHGTESQLQSTCKFILDNKFSSLFVFGKT